MAVVTYAGADVLHGEVHIPIRGAWWANLKLDQATAPSVGSSGALAGDGGLSLSGTVVKSGAFLDASFVRVAGGAGGMGVSVPPKAFQTALVRDVLSAILNAAGENASSTISPSLTNLSLQTWTLTSKHAARLLDELCWAVGQATGQQPINWRPLGDGTIWIGAESWPSQSLPAGADVLWQHPVGPWFEIGCETPALLPGVNLSDIGGLNVVGVDHWIEPHSIRTWAWT